MTYFEVTSDRISKKYHGDIEVGMDLPSINGDGIYKSEFVVRAPLALQEFTEKDYFAVVYYNGLRIDPSNVELRVGANSGNQHAKELEFTADASWWTKVIDINYAYRLRVIVKNQKMIKGDKVVIELFDNRAGGSMRQLTIPAEATYRVTLDGEFKPLKRYYYSKGTDSRGYPILAQAVLKPEYIGQPIGPEYEYDAIRSRIIENTTVPGTPLLIEKPSPQMFSDIPNDIGLASNYRLYCIRLYAFVTRPKQAKREYIPIALREDIAKLDRYIEQMDFLYQHKIEDKVSLQSKKDALVSELKQALIERRKIYTLRDRAVRQHDTPLIAQSKSEISDISRKIRELRKQIALCDAVAVSSDRIAEGLEAPTKKPELDKPNLQREPKKRHKF